MLVEVPALGLDVRQFLVPTSKIAEDAAIARRLSFN